jgi:hypothetical protein
MKNYDINFVMQLWWSSKTKEGGIFNNSPEGYTLQISFLEKWFEIIKPKHIVEIGTNKSNFVYVSLMNCPDVILDTYDIDPDCENGINLVKGRFPNSNLNFHCGSSFTVLDEKPPHHSPIDLFYVDGLHTYEGAKNDILKASELGSKYILVDDLFDDANNGGVPRAIQECLLENNWKKMDQTPVQDTRGMAIFSQA